MVPILSHTDEDGVRGIPLQIRKDIGRLPVGSAVDAVLSPGDIGYRQAGVSGAGDCRDRGGLACLENGQLAGHGGQLLVAALHNKGDTDIIHPGVHRRSTQDLPIRQVRDDGFLNACNGGDIVRHSRT